MSQQCCPATPEERDRNLATAIRTRADKLAFSGNLALSATLLTAAHGLIGASGGYGNDAGLWVYNSDGILAILSDDAVGAEESFRKALLVATQVFGTHSVEAATCQNNLAQALAAQAKYEESQTLFTTAIATLEAIRPTIKDDDEHKAKLEHVDNVLADANLEFGKMKEARAAAALAQSAKLGSQWIDANRSTLPVNECVAANADGLVAHSPSWDGLFELIKSKGVPQAGVTVAFIEAPGPALVRQPQRQRPPQRRVHGQPSADPAKPSSES